MPNPIMYRAVPIVDNCRPSTRRTLVVGPMRCRITLGKTSLDASSPPLSSTHLLGLAVVIGIVPLLRLVRGRGNLPGRLAELLGRRLRRHGELSGLCLWG